MIADYLKAIGVHVFHIMGTKKVQEHPYTSAAQGGRVDDSRIKAIAGVERDHEPTQLFCFCLCRPF